MLVVVALIWNAKQVLSSIDTSNDLLMLYRIGSDFDHGLPAHDRLVTYSAINPLLFCQVTPL